MIERGKTIFYPAPTKKNSVTFHIKKRNESALGSDGVACRDEQIEITRGKRTEREQERERERERKKQRVRS